MKKKGGNGIEGVRWIWRERAQKGRQELNEIMRDGCEWEKIKIGMNKMEVAATFALCGEKAKAQRATTGERINIAYPVQHTTNGGAATPTHHTQRGEVPSYKFLDRTTKIMFVGCYMMSPPLGQRFGQLCFAYACSALFLY
jgi:hypothetical protein